MDDYYGEKEVLGDVEAPKDEVIIRGENLHKTYLLGIEGVPALRGVTLSVKRGEFIVIFGLSGGGKTTLMNIIGTIDTPTKGDLYISGHHVGSKTEDKDLSMLRLRKIGFVFQTFNLLSSLTALENVELPMVLAGDLSMKERRDRATQLLQSVGMGDRLDHYPSQLSGGEQQRVTIARSIANSPEILLLDEPTGDLDSLNTAVVIKKLIALNREHKITLVMVTHDVGLKNFAHRVIWMRDGKIHNIETISQKTRERREALLADEHARLVKGQHLKRTPFHNTVLRLPTHYDTHPNYDPSSEPQKLKFSSSYRKMEDISLSQYEEEVYARKSHLAGSSSMDLADDGEETIDETNRLL